MKRSVKILLGQLNSNGDCLLATTVARQIKHDYPDSKLTWAIGKCCRHVLFNNPDVDEVIEFDLEKVNEENVTKVWNSFMKYAIEQKKAGVYDLVFYTQYSYGHSQNYMGITRASIFGGYPKKITVPITPVIELTEQEKEKVNLFAHQKGLKSFFKVILFECAAFSGQSFIDEEFVRTFCSLVAAQNPDWGIILTSSHKFDINLPNVIHAHELSFRENAALINYCDLLLGCSSGITWLSTASSVKKIPKIILLNDNCPQASMILDHKYFRLPYDHIFEAKKCSPREIIELIKSMDFRKGISQEIKMSFSLEDVLYYYPFHFHLDRKNWKKVMSLFKRAGLEARMPIISSFAKSILRSLTKKTGSGE